jgi:profilin-like protein
LQVADGAFYAAAPVEGDAGWNIIYADEHEEKILQDDGVTEKPMSINEGWQMKQLLDTGKTPAGGVWFAKEKYTVPQCDLKFEMGENTFAWAMACRPKKGAHIVSTGSQIVAGFWDESKGQSSGNCKKTVLAFAEYLKGIGY